MATPTPGKHAPAAVATPPVSTPFSASNHPSHPAFSPHKPHSANPSPQHFKKSPANLNTIYGYQGGHPSFGFDSPSAAMALGGHGMDVGGGIDGVDLMEMPMAGLLGMGAVVGGPTSEDVKGQRLEEVLEILRANKGRLSEPGLQRLAERFKLDFVWGFGSGRGNSRSLMVAGTTFVLDVDFEDNVVRKVTFKYESSLEAVAKHAKASGEVLFRDLEFGPGESQLTKKLDRFAANLERLTKLDNLSKMPELDCHEAIAGIYESIERLHLWEVQRLKEREDMKGKGGEEIMKAAMCTASGKPVMHARDRLGMSLDYWRDRRLLKGSGKETTYALLVECAKPAYLHYSPVNYSPIRVSQHWISANIERAVNPAEELFMTVTGPVLDWLQPDATLISDEPKSDGMEGVIQGQKFPEVTFVARFDPPLTVPDHIANQIYNSVGIALDTNNFLPVVYDELLLPRYPGEVSDLNKRELSRSLTVPVFNQGVKSTSEHRHNLLIEKRDFGRELREIQFSHPQQLVEWLPALRQAACLNSLLLKSFGPATRPCSKEKDETRSTRSEVDMFLKGEVVAGETSVDVQLLTQPVPRLTVAFPFTKAREVGDGKEGYAQVVFEVKLNGELEVVAQNVLEDVGLGITNEGMGGNVEGDRELTERDLARMLEVMEDIGAWVEFVRRRLG